LRAASEFRSRDFPSGFSLKGSARVERERVGERERERENKRTCVTDS